MCELLTTLEIYNYISLFDNVLFLLAMSNTIIPAMFMDYLRICSEFSNFDHSQHVRNTA